MTGLVRKNAAQQKPLPDFVVFDLETTGLDFLSHEIVEIGAVRVSADLAIVRAEYATKVRPRHIENALPEALTVNGYHPEGWNDAPELADALREFVAFGKGGLLAGFNVTFDWAFLEAACNREAVRQEFDYHRLDIFSIAFEMVLREQRPVAHWDLGSLCALYQLPQPPEPHRALEDARAALALWKAARRG